MVRHDNRPWFDNPRRFRRQRWCHRGRIGRDVPDFDCACACFPSIGRLREGDDGVGESDVRHGEGRDKEEILSLKDLGNGGRVSSSLFLLKMDKRVFIVGFCVLLLVCSVYADSSSDVSVLDFVKFLLNGFGGLIIQSIDSGDYAVVLVFLVLLGAVGGLLLVILFSFIYSLIKRFWG